LFVWECDCDWAASEVNERKGRLGAVESVAAAHDQLHFVVQGFGSGVAELQAAGGEDAGTVLADRFAEPDERWQAAAGQAREEPVEQLADRFDGQALREDRADHLLHRPGAGDLPAAGLDLRKDGGLLVAEIARVLQQRPAVVLELLGGTALTSVAQLVPVLAADLVQRLGRERHHVVVVDHDLGLRRTPADGLGVPAGHVHRDRREPGRAREDRGVELDAIGQPGGRDAVADRHGRCGAERDHDRRLRLPRAAAVAQRASRSRGAGGRLGWGGQRGTGGRWVERVEELFGRRCAFPVAAPHDLPGAVIANERQVPMSLAPRDLIDRDLEEIAETIAIELLAGDSFDDPPDRRPIDPDQTARGGPVGLRHKPRHQALEIAGEPGAGPGERHRLDQHPVLRAAQASETAANLQTPDPKIQVPPRGIVMLATLAMPSQIRATRALQPTAAQRDPNNDSSRLELDRADPHPGEQQQARECGADAHG
jgi:hypothetical protein